MKKIALVFLLTIPVMAQSPKLTPSVTVAAKSLQMRAQQLQQAISEFQGDVAAVDTDVRREAPGYHLNPQTFQIEKELVTTTPAPALKQPPPPVTTPKK